MPFGPKIQSSQSLIVLPSRMLALKREQLNIQLTLLLLLLAFHLTQIDAGGGRVVGGFVTKRLQSNWPTPTPDEFVGESDAVRRRAFIAPLSKITFSNRDNVTNGQSVIEQHYMLRYRPQIAMPRLFWHKFPQQQQQEDDGDEGESAEGAEPSPTNEEPTNEEPVDEPEESEDPMEVPQPEQPSMPPPPITTTPAALPEPEPATTTPAAPVNDAPTPNTTITTIMRPPINYKPSDFGSQMKNWLYGSPIELNLLQKKHSSAGSSNATAYNNQTIRTKSKGFLSLFEVIKFENSKCSVIVGDIRTMEGVCYHDFECKSLGGISTERCADGVGVCCVFLTGCGDVTNQPIVYFESPNYPNAVRDAMICVLTVNLRKNVQQLRLDLLMFELSRPSNGDCIDDQFVVSGYNANFAVPVLCGINTGQHVYVHAGDSFERKIYLSFFARAANGGRSFNIKITQLESDLAPDGCLQYYTAKDGVLKSFNYDIIGSIVDNMAATYLNNLNYVICLARAKDTCSVLYSVEQLNEELPEFQIVNKDGDETDLVGEGQAGAGIFNCPDDFVGVNEVRLCGERFNDGSVSEDYTLHAPVRDIAPGPIVLPFRSDDQHVGRGFRLVYKQEACGSFV